MHCCMTPLYINTQKQLYTYRIINDAYISPHKRSQTGVHTHARTCTHTNTSVYKHSKTLTYRIVNHAYILPHKRCIYITT